MSTPAAGLPLVAKSDLIKAQLGIPAATSIPDTVAQAAELLELVSLEGSLAQKVEACCHALFGEPSPEATVASPNISDGSQPLALQQPVAAEPAPIVLAAEPSAIAAFRTKPASISSAHVVVSHSTLRGYMQQLELDGMVAELDADCGASGDTDDDKKPSAGTAADHDKSRAGWYAEHARAQLAPNSGCESKPAWIARVAHAARSSASGEPTLCRLLSLWSADGKATRRALLALQLVQRGMSVEVRAFGDSGDFAAQVQRWAYEQEAFELREALGASGSSSSSSSGGSGSGVGPSYAATLHAAQGEELERLRKTRNEAAEADGALAWAKIEDLSKRLLELDPEATMNIAPNPSRPGSFVLNQLKFKGHLMEFAAEIDRHSNLEALEKVATVSCMCCSGGESPVEFGSPTLGE